MDNLEKNNYQTSETAGEEETQFACGIEWCREYISLTAALNDYIEQGDMVKADSLLEKRQGMLTHLPDVIKTESRNGPNGTFIELLGTIKTLENQGKEVLNTKITEVVNDVKGVQRYKRASAYTKENTVVSRFIDKKG
jgi:hypothetical protein